MEFETQQSDVRGEYSHALAEACQRFVGSLLVLEPDAFVNGVTRLTAGSPRPGNRAEAVLAWTSLRDVVTRGANQHHAWFHTRLQNTPCGFCVAPLRASDSFEADRACSIVRDWATQFVWAFDTQHQWPWAIRAAFAMRSDPLRTWYVDELSDAIGTSRATLERSFNRIYRTTVQRYRFRLRIRAVVEHVRDSDECIEATIREAGFRSLKDAYGPFRRLTGLTFADLRRLADTEFAALMNGPLALPLPGELKPDYNVHGCTSTDMA